ncbi:MAG: hypothetical protein AMDU1_APLC00053G0006 [Thermoplasmatales archaeon A-plasma]|nr:MAG: hypothetical protein AMDU1_APLC00053G0006 [Thermoplasmatales archaeon A-plasma]
MTYHFPGSNAFHWDIPNGIFVFSSEEFQEFVHCETGLFYNRSEGTSVNLIVIWHNYLPFFTFNDNVTSGLSSYNKTVLTQYLDNIFS